MLQKQIDATDDFLDRIYNTEINSSFQYRVFFRTLRNGLHIIKHDHSFWHRMAPGAKRPSSVCVLRNKINRRLKGWEDAVFSVSHSREGNLWATLVLPDCVCIDCGVLIKLGKQRCLSCACYFVYRNKPFYEDYGVQALDLNFGKHKGKSGLEIAYRMTKMLGPREKLEITHIDCIIPKRCTHVRGSLLFKLSAGKLPGRETNFRFSIVGKTTRIVRK